MAALRFYLLGTPRVEVEGTPLDVDTRKATALAIYLALTGQPHRRERLAAFFWPEADEARAGAALRRTLSVLNKALGGRLSVDRETVALAQEPSVWVDAVEFERRVKACSGHGHPAAGVCSACLPLLSEAVGLYEGEFMAGFSLRDSPAFDDWQFFQSETLKRELAEAHDKLERCYEEAGDFESAITQARRWLALDNIHEPAHRRLMMLYARTGQRAAALRQYQECARLLEAELGVGPLDETVRLFEAIKANALEPAGRPKDLHGPAEVSERAAPLSATLPLIGRAAELESLQSQYDSLSSDGCLWSLEGEAGVGKTRLAEAFCARVRDLGGTVLAARCYEGEHNLAYGPFVDALRAALALPTARQRIERLEARWLSEAARLLPEAGELRPGLPAVTSLDSPGAQSRFFEGIAQVLLALSNGRPALIFLDDLQWLDAASFELFSFLARRLRGHRLGLLVTWRSEGLTADARLQALLAEGQRASLARRLTLGRLDLAAVRELVRATQPEEFDRAKVERLYRETEGLPLFLSEYLSGSGAMDAGGDWPLPAGARDLLRARLSSVDETGRQLLSAAAVIGRSFDFETLQAVSGRGEEETIAALESLLAHHFVREVDETPIYDFSHDKLRTLIYDDTSLARRHLLHRRTAEALAARARLPGAQAALAGQVALHYRLSGRNAEAAHFHEVAGNHARRLYANAEALAHYEAALALGHPEASRLCEALGDLRTLSGDYAAALTYYERAAAYGQPADLAGLEHKLGGVYERRGDGELAERHFAAALAAAGDEGPAGLRARVLADWSLTAHHRGQMSRAQVLAGQALALAEAAGDQPALAQAHNILGILASSGGDLAGAQIHLQRSLALAEALGDVPAQSAALNNLALAHSANDRIAEAIAFTERALALSAALGDRHREAALHNNLADLLHADGQGEAAMSHLKQAVGLFAEIGLEPGDPAARWQPAIWKMTEW